MLEFIKYEILFEWIVVVDIKIYQNYAYDQSDSMLAL